MIFPDFVPAEYHQALTDAMDLYEIDAPNRAFAFLANCAHESAGFTRLVENLNYSPQRLAAVFPRRFTAAETVDFAHDEQRIAERIYGGRMGNGAEGTGDGFAYRGRGFLMLTGRNQYRYIGRHIGEPLEDQPDRAAIPGVAALVAADYWASKGCNLMADAGRWDAITRAINGGMLGHEERLAWQARFANAWRDK